MITAHYLWCILPKLLCEGLCWWNSSHEITIWERSLQYSDGKIMFHKFLLSFIDGINWKCKHFMATSIFDAKQDTWA